MSSLLEQAIIDANDLRAAALKSAESAILERYSAEVKNAVDSLLEQEMLPPEEEDPLAGFAPEAALGTVPAEEEALPPEEGIAMAAAEEQPLCPCPDDEEDMEIEFKLEDLLQVADEMGEGQPFAQEELAMAMAPELAGEAPMPMPGEEEEEREQTPEQEIIALDTSVGSGTYIEQDVRYIRITNLSKEFPVMLTFKNDDADEFLIKVDKRGSFIYTGETDTTLSGSGVQNSFDAKDDQIQSTDTMGDLVNITAFTSASVAAIVSGSAGSGSGVPRAVCEIFVASIGSR